MNRIDISKIVADKNPKLSKRLPRFIVRAFERLICANRVNYVLENYSHLNAVDFIGSSLSYMGVEYQLFGTENIPVGQKIVFASNHPFGGLDGLILAHGLSKEMPDVDVKLIVNDILMNVEPLRAIFVPVNKHGSQGVEYAIAQKELYESDSAIITFPAGLCSRLIGGKIVDTQWKKNFVVKAKGSGRVVVPTYVAGRNSMLFYRTAKWRVRLGIKANIEMLLLPREMFAQKDKHVKIYFGTPIAIDNSEHTPAQLTQMIRAKVYEMQK